ncbi:MAG: hypothetical protein IJU77_09530 [Butyrivibrio sp.]|nr:hypothetical protein [Butyrivibrio sp.]
MQIIGLTKDNVEYFKDYLTADVADNIGRRFTCGMVLIPDDEENDEAAPTDEEPSYEDLTPVGAIVWELRQGEGTFDIDSRILSVKAKDEEAADTLLEEYSQLVVQMEGGNSYFELPSTLGSVEKKALEKAGFSLETREGDVISVALADLGMALDSDGKTDDEIKHLSEAEERDFDNAIARLDDEGKRGSCEDMPYLPMDYFDSEISCFKADEDDLFTAVVLMHRRPSGKIDVDLAEVVEDAKEDIKKLLKQSVVYAEDICDPGTKFFFDRSNPALKKLTKELFPTAKGAQVYSGFRKEELPEPVEAEEGEDYLDDDYYPEDAEEVDEDLL